MFSKIQNPNYEEYLAKRRLVVTSYKRMIKEACSADEQRALKEDLAEVLQTLDDSYDQ